MGLGHSPSIVMNGLAIYLDAANPKNFNLTEVEVLVVAGGGGGGSHHGGGGGGGGVVYNTNFSVTPGSALTVTVGGGGSGGTYSPNANGGNGGNSVFGSISAVGGGGGGTYPNSGVSGGSGGGSNNWSTSATGGSATSGQGFAGGSNNGQTNYGGGGGGAGGTAKGLSNNSGGDGLTFNISGSQVYYGGGGGAGVYPGYQNDTSYGYGGLGGGGNGGNGPHGSGTVPTAGGTNTGGGGGGVADLYQNGAVGGSGIVIVRYQGPQKAIGGTVTTSAGHTIHTFTTVGSTTFTPLVATNNSAILGLSDLSNNGNFGTSVNGPTYSSDNGGSIVFDGTNDYTTLSSSQIAPGTGSFTWNFWTKLNDLANFSIVFSGAGSNTDYGVIFMDPRNGTGGLGYYALGTRISDNNTAFGSNWWCITFVGNGGANGSRNLKLYRNAVQAGSTYTFDYNFTSTTPNIGANHSSYAELMRGNISNVSYYNKALTAAEISQNFNALRGRFGI